MSDTLPLGTTPEGGERWRRTEDSPEYSEQVVELVRWAGGGSFMGLHFPPEGPEHGPARRFAGLRGQRER